MQTRSTTEQAAYNAAPVSGDKPFYDPERAEASHGPRR